MNKCYLQDTKVLFHPFESDPFEVGELKDANIENGYLILNNQCYPLEERFECEKEIIEAWKLIYPDGKPITQSEPHELIPTDTEINKAQFEIDTINLLKELGVIPNVE